MGEDIGGLYWEQIREKLLEHGNRAKFWKGPGNPHLGDPQCSAPTIYFNVRGARDEGFASENKNHHARGSAQKINQFQ